MTLSYVVLHAQWRMAHLSRSPSAMLPPQPKECLLLTLACHMLWPM